MGHYLFACPRAEPAPMTLPLSWRKLAHASRAYETQFRQEWKEDSGSSRI